MVALSMTLHACIRTCTIVLALGGRNGGMTQPPRRSTQLVSRRAALQLMGAGTGIAVLAACAPIAPAPQAGATVGALPGAPVGQPKAGGKLRLNGIDPSPLDGHTIGANGSQIVTWHIWEPLVYIGQDLKLEPRLAESYDPTPDLKQ